MNDSGISFLIACGIHAFLLMGTAGFFVRPPSYDVEPGTGGVEVSLVAALPASSKPEVPNETLPEAEVPAADLSHPKPEEQAPQTAHPSSVVGDGSSPVPGKDSTTFYMPGGAAAGSGGRFRNPAPAYPYESIRRGEEGLVMLDVSVDKSGHPADVKINQSSGFPLLDQSALRTVRRWRFDPAYIGILPIDAKIRVPIRFVLEEELRRLR